jgi:alpha-galactosidase
MTLMEVNPAPIALDGRPLLRPLTSVAPAGVEHRRLLSERGPDGRVWEFGFELRTSGAVELSTLDALRARLVIDDPREWRASWFESSWGTEFSPVEVELELPFRLSVTSGRSSHGAHPWLALTRPGAAIVVSPAWSGNWHISIDAHGLLTAGVTPDGFRTVVTAAEPVVAPSVFVAIGHDVDDAASALARAVAADVVPRSPASEAVPVEWNHWWPYEDAEISEQVFLANADVAARLGIETVTLDAGWFGRPDAGSDWQRERGDWDEVNTERFPSGLPALGEQVRSRGLDIGIWIEAEAVGAAAQLRRSRPEIIARRRSPAPSSPSITVSLDPEDPGFLGYVCLGSEAGRDFVLESMSSTIRATGARWLKLDFNVDPGAGCDRTDHGHGAHDGLYRHYVGLYAVLDAFRDRHPEVILEACSSGGLRIDLGLAAHVHCSFLSDPDWTEHHLQVLWGASLLLPPVAQLHWSWSQWRGENADQERDWASLPVAEFAAMLRAAMLHRFGVSLRLPDLRPDLLDCLEEHVRIYRNAVAPLVRDGELHRLTAQPLRGGAGERVPSFQLSADDHHVVVGVVLPGGTTPPMQRVTGLDPERMYAVTDMDAGAEATPVAGHELLRDGMPLRPGAASWLLLLSAV